MANGTGSTGTELIVTVLSHALGASQTPALGDWGWVGEVVRPFLGTELSVCWGFKALAQLTGCVLGPRGD